MTIKYVHNIWSCLVSATRVNSPCITVMLTLKQLLIASGVTLLHGRVVIHTYSTKLCSVYTRYFTIIFFCRFVIEALSEIGC